MSPHKRRMGNDNSSRDRKYRPMESTATGMNIPHTSIAVVFYFPQWSCSLSLILDKILAVVIVVKSAIVVNYKRNLEYYIYKRGTKIGASSEYKQRNLRGFPPSSGCVCMSFGLGVWKLYNRLRNIWDSVSRCFLEIRIQK